MQVWKKKRSEVTVEACLVTEDSVNTIANWAQAQVVEEKNALSDDAREALNVKTPEGKKRASHGTYVVKHGDNFYVLAKADFELRYEPVIDIPLPEVVTIEEHKSLINDPFEGMTRFEEGPRP